MIKYNRIAVTLIALALLGGCAVVAEGPDGISLRHSAQNSAFVQSKAQKHCEAQGKEARLVQVSPIEHTYLVQTVISTFDCI